MWFERVSDKLENTILDLLQKEDGLTDQEISEKTQISLQHVHAVCGQLVFKGRIERVKLKGKPIENHLKK